MRGIFEPPFVVLCRVTTARSLNAVPIVDVDNQEYGYPNTYKSCPVMHLYIRRSFVVVDVFQFIFQDGSFEQLSRICSFFLFTWAYMPSSVVPEAAHENADVP